MAYTGSGTQVDPYVVDNWADFLTAAQAAGTGENYVKWADKSDPSEKVVSQVTLSLSTTLTRLMEVDFNGWTFNQIDCGGTYTSQAYYLGFFNSVKIYNWHVKVMTVNDFQIQLFSKVTELHNCYFDRIILTALGESSDFWAGNPVSDCFFMSFDCYNCVMRMESENAAIIIPDGVYHNCELYIDYKYTLDSARKTKNSLFVYEPYLYNTYLGGTIDVSGGTGSFAITWPKKDVVHGNVYPPGFSTSNSIINIKTIVSDSCTISAYDDNTNFTYIQSNIKSYFVTNNGNNSDGYISLLSTIRCAQGDIKNRDRLIADTFPFIADDSTRYDQYSTDRSQETWTWRQQYAVNDGIPFNPFWFYPTYTPPPYAEDVDENPYICIFDMETAQTDFGGHGLAILRPTSCKIVEELNGEYNLTLTHPRDSEGKWQYLLEWNIIKALGQLFVIQQVDEVQTGGSAYIQVYAEHITYTLNDKWIFPPVTIAGYGGQTLIDNILAQSTDMGGDWQTQYTFNITSDINADPSFRDWYDMPDGVTPYEMLIGSNGFIAKLGGELYRDNFVMRINERMYLAEDNAFEMSIGYNLTGIRRTVDLTTFCTYFRGYDISDPESEYGTWFAISWDPSTLPRAYPRNVVRSQNFSYQDPEYAEGRLERDTITFFNQNCAPLISYELSVQDLKKNPDYKMFDNNYRYKVGDRGKVWDERLESWVELEITRTEKDAITGECTKVVIGTQRSFTRPNGYTPIIPRSIIIPAAEKTIEGNPPLDFNSNGDNLVDWEIHGASGGVGDAYNLCSSIILNGSYSTSTGSWNGYSSSWVATDTKISVSPDTTYTFSMQNLLNTSVSAMVLEYDAGGNYLGYTYGSIPATGGGYSFTTKSTTSKIHLQVVDGNISASDIGNFNLNSGSTQKPYVPYGKYGIPVTISDGTNSTTTMFVVDTPLGEGDSISRTTEATEIATYEGECTLTVGTTVQPRVKITYKEGT
jgi:phage minor structural protein